MTAALLPNGKQYFVDNNGEPLVGGLVYFYIPSTDTPKDTWSNYTQGALNTNPVVLDSRGEATIFGSGMYRQVLKDSLGNLIWDKITFAVGGASSTTIKTVSTDYTISLSDGTVLVDATSGAITITLPSVVSANQSIFTVKKIDQTANLVTLVGDIDEITDYVLYTPEQSVTVQSNGTGYWVL